MRLRLFLHPPETSNRTFSFILMDHEFVLGYRVQIYILIYLSLLLICTMCSHVDFLCYTILIQLCLFSGTLSDSSVWITDAICLYTDVVYTLTMRWYRVTFQYETGIDRWRWSAWAHIRRIIGVSIETQIYCVIVRSWTWSGLVAFAHVL